MPQLDFSTYASQIFWLIIFFGTLYSFVVFIFYPSMSATLKSRKSFIDKQHSDLKNTLQELEMQKQIRAKSIEEAKTLAAKILKDSTSESSKIRSEYIKKTRSTIIDMHIEQAVRLKSFRKNSRDDMIAMSKSLAMIYFNKFGNKNLANIANQKLDDTILKMID